MRKLYLSFIRFTLILLVVLYPFAIHGEELSPKELKDIQMELSVEFAAKYLEEMYEVQSELVTNHSDYSDLIMALAAGELNLTLPLWLKDLAKLKNQELDTSTMYFVMSISTMKLSFLAQQFGITTATVCHLRESENLQIAAKGGEPKMANCRLAAYGNIESRALRLSTTKEAEKVIPLVKKWGKLNARYSKAMACASGYCI